MTLFGSSFASRGSGVQIPSAPPSSCRSDGLFEFLVLSRGALLRPLLAVIGRIPLKDLTVQDVRGALKKMAGTHSTRTLQKGHNCLTRAVRHAEGQDLVRRNVSALVDTPRGREGRPSQSLTLDQAEGGQDLVPGGAQVRGGCGGFGSDRVSGVVVAR